MEASEGTSTGETKTQVSNSRTEPNVGRKPRNNRDRAPRTTDIRSKMSVVQHAPRRHHRPPRGAEDNQSVSGSSIPVPAASAVTVSADDSTPPPRTHNFKSRHPPSPPNNNDAGTTSNSGHQKLKNNGRSSDKPRPGGGGFRRGAKFTAELTGSDSAPPLLSKLAGKDRCKQKRLQDLETLDDLTSRLILALRTAPYPDCPICFSPIHPAQPTWSCSPSIPIIRSDDAGEQQYCWTAFHVKCIGSWATKSVKDIADAWRARGEEGRRGDWRCPGCQAKREIVPSGYWCFCNSTPEPKPPRLATPHSCGNPCSRVRESGCGHACPLACHPGPCPPCQVYTQLECYCPKKKVLAFRCGLDQGRGTKGRGRDLCCGSVCGRTLLCGKHACEKVCHDGDCDPCAIREIARCWCGKEEKEVGCGEGEAVVCSAENEEAWVGRFGCLDLCGRLFDCGTHKCQQPCHRPSYKPASCPRSPSKITHCPCGKRRVASSANDTDFTAFPARSHCTSPIPTCTSPCDKLHANCGHPCVATCHTGPCPPCSVPIVRPCRCGATTRAVRCYEFHPPDGDNSNEIAEILCEKPCTVLRACGRHQCRRPCCPLASLALTTGKKGKKRADGPELESGVGEERGGLHECDLICGKILSCGNHRCEERDHKGVCPPCLRSSFEEMVCYCGRTILEPPIPCGTEIRCTYQCSRPPPPCGHPRSQHSCHEEPSPCPPCPFLATKKCACGKKTVDNVRCSLEDDKVSCGTVCGKLMTCGFHRCERLCHGDICGPCSAPCAKSRKLCLPAHHPCTQSCHAPSACSEDEPCQSLLTLTCSCRRIHQAVHCGRSSLNTAGAQRAPPKCNNECSIAKRNARLADALGITPESREKVSAVSYHEELVAFAKANSKFLGVVEKALAEFVNSDKKTQVLPHMPPERRKFVHDLASMYRMETEMVDQEPYRSVRLFRRLDTRIPTPLLSSTITSPSAGPPSLGKLVDMRSSAAALSWRSNSTQSLSKPSMVLPSGPTRGWSSAATRQTSAATIPKSVHTPVPDGSVRTPSSRVSSSLTPAPSAPIVNAVSDVPDDWEDDV